MNPKPAETFIEQISPDRVAAYESYFRTLAPRTVEDVFKRWMFAYASVHTTWEANCKLYQELQDLSWVGNRHALLQRIERSHAGLHNNRTQFIMQFSNFYWKHPLWFNRVPGEDWFDYRDRIMERAPGIGPAKAAFLLELVYFHRSQVACFDTHMVQLYGTSTKAYAQGRVRDAELNAMERAWTAACQARGLSPCTARWIYWDTKQGKQSSTYWSYVLETNAKENEHATDTLGVAEHPVAGSELAAFACT